MQLPITVLVSLFLAINSASAHMTMKSPTPFKSQYNPNTKTPDYNLKSPLGASQYPCKGYHTLVGTPEGASVATWAAGSSQSFTIDAGGASHGGGSCQASFSEDGGNTFKVAKSYIGACPLANGGTFDFIVPKEIKSGAAIFAWTWFNRIGNREMYMDCAPVTITGGTGSGLSDYPDIFTANIGGTCTTKEGADVLFPNPGKSLVNNSNNTTPPAGNCGPVGSNNPPPAPVPSSNPPVPSVTNAPPPPEPSSGQKPPAPEPSSGQKPPAPEPSSGQKPPAPEPSAPAPAPSQVSCSCPGYDVVITPKSLSY